jgi:hypothetical protein
MQQPTSTPGSKADITSIACLVPPGGVKGSRGFLLGRVWNIEQGRLGL